MISVEENGMTGSALDELLERLRHDRRMGGRIAHVERIPAREACFADPGLVLDETVGSALAAAGVERLYSHQGEAIEATRQKKNVVVVTGTASGKTLCYNIPVLEGLLDGSGTALYLFPTKALAQDQLRGLTRLLETDRSLAEKFHVGTYDGDTSRY